jgi:hypothetical protein
MARSLTLLFVIGVPTFASAHRRRLDVLTGPWIRNEVARRDDLGDHSPRKWSTGLDAGNELAGVLYQA